MIKRKITDLDKMKIEEQRKPFAQVMDMDILPSDLVTYGAEAKTLLESLQSRNERLFLVTFLLMNIADNKRKLGKRLLSNRWHRSIGELQSATSGLPAGTRSGSHAATEDQPGSHRKSFDHFRHSDICALHHAGTLSTGSCPVLWAERSLQ